MPAQTEYAIPDDDREQRIRHYVTILLVIQLAVMIIVLTFVALTFVGLV